MAEVTVRDSTGRLLEQAVEYGLGCLDQVPSGGMRLPTPCRGWDLDALLCHLHESVCALREAAEYGEVALLPSAAPPADPVAAVRSGARALLESWRGRDCPQVAIGGMPVPGATVAFIGVVELAVHGWDVAQACGSPRPIPVPLALAILRRAPMITGGTGLFAAPVPVSPLACPSDRLVASLGRAPDGRGPADESGATV